MFISRLELSGFKSFASKTGLDFRPGVMAVVGPNGCGKTNIVDAVRWVLGEQRTGALRAERMESVIFNGTAKRRPVGMAEVTLTVENDRGLLPSAFTQVEITRRLFRSGESEYLINRTPSRLRDIQDLFVDTGFGHSTYSIIELSMVEGIISGPSESRRALFEEAAGVAKFKSRRNAAERRLESTKEALERLKDVYNEVEKSYQTLKRQSSRARRYQSLSRALQLRLIADLARERLGIVARRQPIEVRLFEIEKILLEAESASSRLSTELLTLEAAEINLDGKIGRAQESSKRVERREAELDGELALVKQRSRQLTADADSAVRRIAELKALIETSSSNDVAAKAEAEQLTALLKDLEKKRHELAEEALVTTVNVGDARKVVEQLQLKEAELARKLSTETAISKRTAEERARIVASLYSANQRKDDLGKRSTELTVKLRDVESTLQTTEAALITVKAEWEETAKALETARKSHVEAQSAFIKARAEAETTSRNLTAHQSRGTFLSGLPKAVQATASGKNLLTVAARIHSKPEHRAAIAAALRPILEAIDLTDLGTAVDLAGKLSKGEAALLRIPTSVKGVISSRKVPDGLTPLATLIEGEGEFEQFLKNRLSDVYLAIDRSELMRHSGWAVLEGARLVTTAGEMLESDGVLHAGSIDPEGYRVGWESGLKQLQKSSNEFSKASDDASVNFRASEASLAASDQSFNKARTTLQKTEDDLAAIRRTTNNLGSELQQVNSRLKETIEELQRVEAASNSLPAIDANDTVSLKALGDDHASVTSAKKEASEKLTQLETEQRRTAQSITVNAAELARTGERLNQSVSRSHSAAQAVTSSTKQLAELEAKNAGLGEEQRRTAQAIENLDAQLGLVRREKGELTGALESARAEKGEKSRRKQTVNQELKLAQETLRKVTEERNHLEIEGVSGRERLKEIDRRLVEDAGTQPEAIVPETPTRAEDELQTLELGDVSLEQIKIRIQSLGPVNMLALEELEQVEERYKFLTDQRKDLEGGVELLTETIDRINHEARRRFRETFEQVERNFQQLFRTLFEGGEARITLEGGDPLESDIKIWATPSGKKLQGLPMLSGGEKALTAISLLFAIYMVRPSPFCILDEVDAPLDDANVARYNRLIREFSVNTQFMIVTHNKRSMEAADNLFGVTLAEDGASQLVSVRLGSSESVAPTN